MLSRQSACRECSPGDFRNQFLPQASGPPIQFQRLTRYHVEFGADAGPQAYRGCLVERIKIVPVLSAGSAMGILAGFVALALLPQDDRSVSEANGS